MKRTKALGVAVLTAMSGSLLIGCTSDRADTTASTTPTPASAATPSAYPLGGTKWGATVDRELVGWYWLAEGPGVGLNLLYFGKWTARSWGWLEGQGTYELDGDTITWVGGIDCADGETGTYTYTAQDGRFTQTVQKDPCDRRRESFDGVVFKVVSPPDKWELAFNTVWKRLASVRITTDFTSASDPESFKKMHCPPEQFARSSDSAVVVVVDDLAFEFDDPDLDLDKLSEALGSRATSLKEFCDAVSASAATTTASPLVGTNWYTTEGPGRSCDGPEDLANQRMFGHGLFLMSDGTWNIPWCQSSGGTYEVNGHTITWLGGNDCDAGLKGTYTYALNDDQFTQTVMDDPCGPRRDAFDGVTYRAIQ